MQLASVVDDVVDDWWVLLMTLVLKKAYFDTLSQH